MLTGVFSTLIGCNAEELARALLLILSLMLGGGGEEAVPDPAPVTPIVMYSVAGQLSGNLGGRTGADSTCQINPPAGLPAEYTNFRAFISVDDTTPDTISDMPTNYSVPTTVPVVGPPPSNVLIGNNWSDLIDGNGILKSLEDANVLASGTPWTGSTTTGGLETSHCSNWKSSSGQGQAGRRDTPGANWLSNVEDSCNNPNHHLLCVAY